MMIQLEDGERFGLPMDAVVHACRAQGKMVEFSRQLNELLAKLDSWLRQRSTEVDRAALSLEPDGISFAVVRKDKAFNPEFEDALTELDVEIANDPLFNLIRLHVLALPYSAKETVNAFLEVQMQWSGRSETEEAGACLPT